MNNQDKDELRRIVKEMPLKKGASIRLKWIRYGRHLCSYSTFLQYVHTFRSADNQPYANVKEEGLKR